jgi:prepilin-type N-terminal cleavage/methylation domain-containing protein
MAVAAYCEWKDLARPSLGSAARGRSPARDGFTLVELMVVIVIIIIMMGLLTPVLVSVMASAREARITAEISAMDAAMKAYKERYGQYPPSDFSNSSSPTGPIALHLAHAFPHCNSATEAAAIPANLTAAQALVFWLSGFSPDPEHPITGTGTRTPFFPFDVTRLIGATAPTSTTTPTWGAVYTPADGLGSPYVYFAAQNYATQAPFVASSAGEGGTGIVWPYHVDGGSSAVSPQNLYVNANSFQIISAGLDGDFGDSGATTTAPSTYPSYPSGTGYTLGDMDNLTNFSQGNLKNATPH